VTIWRVLTAVDPVALDRAAGSWVSAQLAARRAPGARVALAVDGKTLRGARAGDDLAPHLLACLDQASGAVCAQVAVDAARTGTGPHVMASIRNLVISILPLAGHASIARALRHTARNPARAFHLLTQAK